MEEELPEYKISPVIGGITPLVWIKYNDEFYVAQSPFFRVFSDSATMQYTRKNSICKYVKDRELSQEYGKLYQIVKDTYNYLRTGGSRLFINAENVLLLLEYLKTTDRYSGVVTDADIDRYTNWLQSVDRDDDKQPQEFDDVKSLFDHRLRLQKKLEYVRTDRFKQFSDRIFAEYMEDGRKRNREYLENHMDDILDNDYKEEIRRDPKTRHIAVAMVASSIVPDHRKGYKVRLPIKKYKHI